MARGPRPLLLALLLTLGLTLSRAAAQAPATPPPAEPPAPAATAPVQMLLGEAQKLAAAGKAAEALGKRTAPWPRPGRQRTRPGRPGRTRSGAGC